MLLCGYCAGLPSQCSTFNYILSLHLSLSTAPGVASVNSACRCVHLPNGGMLCDPVGCELVHVKHCPTMIQFSAYCTIGDTENVKEEKLDKGKSYSSYSSNCWSGSLYCDSVSKQSVVTSSGYKITWQAVLSFRYAFSTPSNKEKMNLYTDQYLCLYCLINTASLETKSILRQIYF